MPTREDWLRSKAAATDDDLTAGNGCHRDEANALGDFLNGTLNAHEAAAQITEPLSHENDPSSSVCRLWALLCDALVELDQNESQKTLQVLCAIRTLPPTFHIDWSELPGFANMWTDLHRLHLHGTDPWEEEEEVLNSSRQDELRLHFANIGTVEAKLYDQGLGDVTADWGYDILNLILSRRPGYDILLSEVYAWLQTAGGKLKENMNPEETRSYSRPVIDGRPGAQKAVRGSMKEHWTAWKEGLIELSGGSSVSEKGRTLAKKSHALM